MRELQLEFADAPGYGNIVSSDVIHIGCECIPRDATKLEIAINEIYYTWVCECILVLVKFHLYEKKGNFSTPLSMSLQWRPWNAFKTALYVELRPCKVLDGTICFLRM